jgi:hypothetical protein
MAGRRMKRLTRSIGHDLASLSRTVSSEEGGSDDDNASFFGSSSDDDELL